MSRRRCHPCSRGRYLAELFSGVGRVAAAARSHGVRAKCWDTAAGPRFDLTKPAAQRALRADARRGKLIGVMLAPPCRTWGPGGNRSFRLRSREEPWGRSCELTDAQKRRLEEGNAQMVASLIIAEDLLENGVPFILEHPAGTYAQFTSRFARLLADPRVHTRTCDQCQWGARWRKRTMLTCGNLDPLDTATFDRRCSGQRGLCSVHGKAHARIVGRTPEGVPWSSVAAAYPHRFAHDLARALTTQARSEWFNLIPP